MKSYKIKNGILDSESVYAKIVKITDIIDVNDGYSIEAYSNCLQIGMHYFLDFVVKKESGSFTTNGDVIGTIKTDIIDRIKNDSPNKTMWRKNVFCGLSKTLYSNNTIGYIYISNDGRFRVGSGGNADQIYAKVSLFI